MALLISNEGIRLIFSKVIAPITYLKSWALVTHVIIFKFLLDSHLFLFGTIGVNSSKPFLFQEHLILIQELLLSRTVACVPLFEQLKPKET